jgi:hypothetical protein
VAKVLYPATAHVTQGRSDCDVLANPIAAIATSTKLPLKLEQLPFSTGEQSELARRPLLAAHLLSATIQASGSLPRELPISPVPDRFSRQ